MVEKKKTKKENSQVDLKEILGDIKTVVSGEKEMLFEVSEYKTINLKKENLVTSGEKNHSSGNSNLDNKELEDLVRKIVKSELRRVGADEKVHSLRQKKTKPVKVTQSALNKSSLKKSELIALSKKNKISTNSKDTKAEIIKKLEQNNVSVR